MTPVLAAQAPASPAAAAKPEPPTDAEFHLPLDDATAREVDRLIPRLGSPAYAERRDATDRLMAVGVPAFAALRAAYRQSDDLEVRWRIEHIVEEAYFDEYVYGRNGFLGISQSQQQFPSHDDDPRIPEGHLGILIQQVHDGTAAARGGLRQSDVIIAFNGEHLKVTDQPTMAFGEMIRKAGPGANVVLTVLRETAQHEFKVTLGRCPPELVKIGNVGAVTQQYFEVRERFRLWWATYFRAPVPP